MNNTTRFIILLIMINVMCGLAEEYIHNPNQLNTQSIKESTEFITSGHEKAGNEESWEENVERGGSSAGTTVGDVILWGIWILKILFNTINPFSIAPWQFKTDLEQAAAWGISLLRMGLLAIVTLQAYLIFKNRKTT